MQFVVSVSDTKKPQLNVMLKPKQCFFCALNTQIFPNVLYTITELTIFVLEQKSPSVCPIET